MKVESLVSLSVSGGMGQGDKCALVYRVVLMGRRMQFLKLYHNGECMIYFYQRFKLES